MRCVHLKCEESVNGSKSTFMNLLIFTAPIYPYNDQIFEKKNSL